MRTEKELAEKIQELLKRGRVLIDNENISTLDNLKVVNKTLIEINGKVEALMWVQGMLEGL